MWVICYWTPWNKYFLLPWWCSVKGVWLSVGGPGFESRSWISLRWIVSVLLRDTRTEFCWILKLSYMPDFLWFFYCVFHTIKIEGVQNLNLIAPLVSKIWIFKLILIWKFQNVPCALGFEVKHSKIFCISFRACIIILIMGFIINKLFGYNHFLKIKQI